MKSMKICYQKLKIELKMSSIFKILDHRLTFHGVCETCRAKGKG
ncbi:hypothetical protein ACVNP1_10165 [Staphylococcus aureus]